jgi:hypothetical protein
VYVGHAAHAIGAVTRNIRTTMDKLLEASDVGRPVRPEKNTRLWPHGGLQRKP